jgi:hypothetical protein
MKKTTIEIYAADLQTWHRWCKKMKLKSAPLMHEIMSAVQNKVRDKLYAQLTTRDDFKKPLSGCKIDKSKISIEKSGSSFT